MDYGVYPPSGNANLIASLRAGSYVNKIDKEDLKKGEMLDPWKSSYVYLNPGKINPKSYDLYSLRKNGLMIMASSGGLRIGPVAEVLKDVGSSLSPEELGSQGQLPSPDPDVSATYLPLAMEFLEKNGYAYVANAIGRNGYRLAVNITLSDDVNSSQGSWNGSSIAITIYDSGNANINTGKIAAILVHEGLHAMHDYMNTAYDVEYTIEEEYVNDVATIDVWKTSKALYGGDDQLLDYYEVLIEAGEDYFKDILRQTYGLGLWPG